MAIHISKAIQHLSAAEPKLGDLIARVGPMPGNALAHTGSSFAYLLRAIVGQQLSGKAAATIHGRVILVLGGSDEPEPGRLLALPVETLRGAGMSAGKIAAARDLAAKVMANQVPDIAAMEKLSDDEIVASVSAVRGIGPWTAQMLLMFRLARPDVLPATDLGIRKGFGLVISNRVAKAKDGLPVPAAILKRGERWAPHRTVASWYLWRSLELP